MTIKETIIGRIEEVRQGLNSIRASDVGKLYFYQEVAAWAAEKAEAEWAKLQETGTGIVNSDDELRALGAGPHVVYTDKRLSVCATVSKPRNNFKLELFITSLCKKFKLNIARVAAIAETSKEEGKASLSKRVVEIV